MSLPPENPPGPGPVLLYSDQYSAFNYGPLHPMRMERLTLTMELIARLGLPGPSHLAPMATLAELAAFHSPEYLKALQGLSQAPRGSAPRDFGLGPGENPAFKGVYEWSALLAGGSLAAARLVKAGGGAAFNLAGGMHHARPGRAAGFCYVNDPVLAILELLKDCERVAYVDIDAHHGDGVQEAFFDSPQVLTISLHQHPATLYPGTGTMDEIGQGRGRGFCLNLPLWPGADDEIYIHAFDQVVPAALDAFQPDYVVTQLGADALFSDPLAGLELTSTGFGHCLRWFRDNCLGRWVALGGGGYSLVNVARAWTLAWAVMLHREDELPAEFPPDLFARAAGEGDQPYILDPPHKGRGPGWQRAHDQALESAACLVKNLLPALKAGP